MTRLCLSAAQVASIIQHLRAVYPEEGCGLLAVPADAETVVQQFPIRNVADEPRRHYFGEPLEVVEALLEIERRGWRLGAIYHSHPHGPAWPSEEDLRQAYYPEALSLLVSLAEPERPTLHVFALRGGEIEERALVIDDGVADTR